MENTFFYFIGFVLISIVLYLFKGKYFKLNRVETLPSFFYKKVKDGYNILLDSLYYSGDKKNLKNNLNNILMQRMDGRYVDGYNHYSNEFDFLSFSLDSFYDLMKYSEKKSDFLILTLDKKVSLNEVNTFLEKSLTHKFENQDFFNFHEKIKKSSFPYRDVLAIYQEKLNKNKIQMGFFSDTVDSYYLFLFPVNKENLIKQAISDIGFEYKREIAFV